MRKQRTKLQRQTLYAKMDGRCGYCGTRLKLSKMQLDHIEPLHLGGEDTLENLMCSCRSCNHYKHTLTVEKYREYILTIGERLSNNVTFNHAVRFGMVTINDIKVKFYFEEIKTNFAEKDLICVLRKEGRNGKV